LAFSAIIAGGAMAMRETKFNWLVFTLCLTTTLFLQILSNLANDYGDAEKGTDNQNRIGPERSIQSGAISMGQMKNGILVFILLSLLSGIALLLFSIQIVGWLVVSLFFLLGVIAIIAAIKYTSGKKAYGYSGFGDIFVFLFFGILGVSGSAFLISGNWNFEYLFIGTTIGTWSAGVLNLNNLRDFENDKNFDKRTIPVRIGLKKGKQYHLILIISGLLSSLLLLMGSKASILNLLFLISFLPIIMHIKRFVGITEPKNFDPELKKLALATFLFSLLLFISNV
jgi:1,4-dihydroxy-2-naphthoate octaprenyltransferase